jgi:hypothetical protein
MLSGLKRALTDLLEAVTNQSFTHAKKTAKKTEYSYPFAEKLDRKKNIHHSGEQSFDFSAEDEVQINIKGIVVVGEVNLWRKLQLVCEQRSLVWNQPN